MNKSIQKILLILPLILLALPLAANAKKKRTKPDHVMILVFDQMRPDYIQRFQLKNFQRLQRISRNYPNAIVGHSASITIVSHSVISSGLQPKQLPWMDDVMWDKEGLLGKPDAMYQSTNLNMEQILRGLSQLPQENQLPARLRKKLSRPIFAVGEKSYAAITMGGPTADSIITMKRDEQNNCKPYGVRVPEYIAKNDRYTVDCSDKYGTENSFYGLDGNHFYPGKDPAHLGGDVWTADIALDIMNHEDWGALFLTFGAIDKFGHLTGEPDAPLPLSFDPPARLEEIAKIADAQLGKILDALESKKLLDRTLIISTADHGGQSNFHYHGNGNGSSMGEIENLGKSEKGALPFWLSRTAETGKIRLGFADSSIRLWLNEDSESAHDQVIARLREVSGVTRILRLQKNANGYEYAEVFQNLSREPKRFQKWANAHDVKLANTMAGDRAPNLIAALGDNFGFQKLGDHGGFQENVQRIPMIVHDPSSGAGSSPQEMRLLDIYPLVVKVLELPEAK